MPANRSTTMGAIWAQSAPDVPATPVDNTTYRNSAIASALIQAGWPFDEVVNSSTINEVMYRLTTLVSLIESFGVLPWSTLTAYTPGSRVLGSNGTLYKSLTTNQSIDPTTDSGANWQAEMLPLGFTPVQQGGGIGQGSDKIYLGMDAISENHIRATIDGTDFGDIAWLTDIPSFNAYSRCWPEILTAGNVLAFTTGSGVISVNGGQKILFRDSYQYTVPGGGDSFSTAPNSVYHLRFAFRTDAGGDDFGAGFYSGKSIAPLSFYLISTNDAAYNPGSVVEASSALDTKLDDMLCARIVTNGSNVATITTLKNADSLTNRTMISGTAANQTPWGLWTGGSFSLNWSRVPVLSVPTFEAVKHENSEITDGTEWGLTGQGALAVFGIRVTSGSLTRYGGTLDYVYDDVDTHNQGWFHVNCVSQA